MKAFTIVNDGESETILSGVFNWPSDTKFNHFHPRHLSYNWTESHNSLTMNMLLVLKLTNIS